MKDFCVLSRPYPMAGDQNSVFYRVQTIEFPGILLHNDRTLHASIVRVTSAGRTWAGFGTEEEAYRAVNDYYALHGEPTPYIRVNGRWLTNDIVTTPATVSAGSEPMEFE